AGIAPGLPPLLRRKPSDGYEMLLVVGRIEPADLDVASALGCVHEAAVAQVDADVRELLLVLKEDEVSRSGRAGRNLARRAELLLRRPRHGKTGLRERVVDEAAAVETVFRARAAIAVGRADESDCELRNGFAERERRGFVAA